MLRAVPTEPWMACEGWAHRGNDGERGPFQGGSCCFCNRGVAIPARAHGRHVCCTYCALDRGLVEAVDVPIGFASASCLPGDVANLFSDG